MADRALGNPLGNPLGLPKAAGFQPKATTYSRIVSGSGVLIPPEGAKLMRVAVIGAGATRAGTSTSVPGGGAGGCAATKIVAATEITYSIGVAPSSPNIAGGDTTALFAEYNLIGGGGGQSSIQLGGTASGGDYNFSGGNGAPGGTNANGGSAAGPNGAGASGSTSVVPGQVSGAGWGPGGGSCSGGSGQKGGFPGSFGLAATISYGSGTSPFNDLGWGQSASTGSGYSSGSGGLVVEWFY
jgi:hypothetical protein